MEMLGRYERTTELSNKDAGSCMWCFAVRGGQEYFVKQFTEGPKYPENDTTSSPEKRAKKIQKCKVFEQKKSRTYRIINEKSDGNVVRVIDFFRVGAIYYMVMPKIKSVKMTTQEISRLPEHVKRRICTVIAHSVAQLHDGHFVHADIKHSNIMLVHSRTSKLTAKLIDYDAGFFEDDPPTNPEAIAGDFVYFSPEVYRARRGEGMYLTCKMDVFALGVLFHQYLTGKMPEFKKDKFESVGEAVSLGETVQVSWDIPADLHRIICRMLAENPEERPTAREVYDVFSKPLKKEQTPTPSPVIPSDPTPIPSKPEAKSKDEKVVCPHCGARHMVGTVSCKYCGTAIDSSVDSTVSKPVRGTDEAPITTPMPKSAESKAARKAICPHCGARQSEDSVKCKYCGTPMHG